MHRLMWLILLPLLTYDNYLILIDKVGSGGLDVNLRLRAAGVDDSSANYQSQRLTC
jgi:hypothetical protein